MPARVTLFVCTVLALVAVTVRGQMQTPAPVEALFDFKPIVDGVYAAVAKPVHNTTRTPLSWCSTMVCWWLMRIRSPQLPAR